MTEIPLELKDWLRKNIFKYPNVIGFSNHYHNRIKAGKVIENTQVIRIYVKKKIPESLLPKHHVIPKRINDIETDVIEIGEVKAQQDRTIVYRPLVMGISVGHVKITAGTLSIPFKDNKGNEYLSSNSHVFTPNPSLPPDQVSPTTITQPGPYDIQAHGWDVNDPKFVAGQYFWHKQIIPLGSPSNCPVAKFWSGIYNVFARALKRKTRLVAILEAANKIDFALMTPSVPYEVKFLQLDITNKKFVGLLFAGSDTSTIICKVENIIKEGYYPVVDYTLNLSVGMNLWKEGRTTGLTQGQIIDVSAVVTVDYETFFAQFDDVIVATAMSQPGDSGSSVFTES